MGDWEVKRKKRRGGVNREWMTDGRVNVELSGRDPHAIRACLSGALFNASLKSGGERGAEEH
jgi:hypothetical protein